MDNERCYAYTMQYHSATNKNEIIKFVGKWMELRTTILSEGNPDPETQRSQAFTRLEMLTLNVQIHVFLIWNTHAGQEIIKGPR